MAQPVELEQIPKSSECPFLKINVGARRQKIEEYEIFNIPCPIPGKRLGLFARWVGCSKGFDLSQVSTDKHQLVSVVTKTGKLQTMSLTLKID